MRLRTPTRVGMLALAAAALAVAVGPAGADPAQDAQNRARLRIIGGADFEPNRFIRDTVRFADDVVNINSGGRLTIQDRTRQPHTLSIVKRSQVPRTIRQVDACFGRGPCDEFARDHGAVDPDTGEEREPTEPLVNKGAPGFNQPGDSVYIPPRRSATVRVTANRDLYYICVPHPWMQGRLNVE
jgi:hypothetical protein